MSTSGMTRTEIEKHYTQLWGCQAWFVQHRISGNRGAYWVTDHNGHHVPLKKVAPISRRYVPA